MSMSSVTTDPVVAQLEVLVEKEHVLEKMLERASRCDLDPRDIAHLWNLATECRDHARILSRHLRERDRSAGQIPYPRWPRGEGPLPEEALATACEIAEDLGGEFRSSESLTENIYLRKFLAILGDEMDRRALELRGLSCHESIFVHLEEPDEERDGE